MHDTPGPPPRGSTVADGAKDLLDASLRARKEIRCAFEDHLPACKLSGLAPGFTLWGLLRYCGSSFHSRVKNSCSISYRKCCSVKRYPAFDPAGHQHPRGDPQSRRWSCRDAQLQLLAELLPCRSLDCRQNHRPQWLRDDGDWSGAAGIRWH